VARRSAREQRIQTLNQIRRFVFCAPEAIRDRFIGRYQVTMLQDMAAMRPRPGADPVAYVTLMTCGTWPDVLASSTPRRNGSALISRP
jgi:hypothetical protein